MHLIMNQDVSGLADIIITKIFLIKIVHWYIWQHVILPNEIRFKQKFAINLTLYQNIHGLEYCQNPDDIITINKVIYN